MKYGHGVPALSRKQKIFVAFFLALIFLFCFQQINNADTFYHLKAGQLIWQTKSIPRTDPYSFTAAGAPWIAHEWLSEVIFYAVQSVFGFWGLITFVALLAVLAFWIILKIALNKGANVYVACATLFAIGAASFQFWVPRPQVFVFVLCVALIYMLEGYRASGKKSYLVLAVLILWCWANMNASVALGELIFALFLIASLFQKGFLHAGASTKKLFFAFLAAITISFANPNTYHVYTYGLTILPSIKAFGVDEWRSILSYWSGWDTKFYIVLIIAGALFLICQIGIKNKRRDLFWLGLAVGGAIMPFIASRYIAYWALLSAAPLAWTLTDAVAESPRFPKRGAVIAGFIIGGALLIWGATTLPRSYVDAEVLPVGASNFLATNNAQDNAFNTYSEGGYLLWRLSPNIKISVDGRSEVYLGQPTADYFAILNGASSTDALVNQKYNIHYFILPDNPSFFATIGPLLTYLLKNNWQVVWWDDATIVIAKNDTQNSALISQYALHYVGPFIDPTKIATQNGPAAAKELNELMDRSPDTSSIIASYTRDFLSTHQ